MSRWNWTFGLLAGPFVVLPGLLLGPGRVPLAGPELAPAAAERPAVVEEPATAGLDPDAMWRAAVSIDTPDAYWTYLRRHADGGHATAARLRLERLSVSSEPPIRFAANAISDLRPVAASSGEATAGRAARTDADPGIASFEPARTAEPGRPAGSSEPVGPDGLSAQAASPGQAADALSSPATSAVAAVPAIPAPPQHDAAAGEAVRPEPGQASALGPADRPIMADGIGPADRLGPAAAAPAVLSFDLAVGRTASVGQTAPVEADAARGPDRRGDSGAGPSDPHRLKLSEVVERPASAGRAAAAKTPAPKVRPITARASAASGHAVKQKRAAARRALRPKPASGVPQRRRLAKLMAAHRAGRGHPMRSRRTVLRHRQYAPAAGAMGAATPGSHVQLCKIVNGVLCGH